MFIVTSVKTWDAFGVSMPCSTSKLECNGAGSPGGFPGRFDGTMAGDACIGEECATDGVGVLALMKAAFVATSEGTATHIASYVEAGTSVGLGGGLLAAGMAAQMAWYSWEGTSVRLGGGRTTCPPLSGRLSAFCC